MSTAARRRERYAEDPVYREREKTRRRMERLHATMETKTEAFDRLLEARRRAGL